MTLAHVVDPSILREYDVRGTVGRTLNESDVHALGRSFATVVRRAGGRTVAVGRDGRVSSPALEAALVAGLTASGVDVVRTGLGPSPQLYFAEAELPVDGGVQVTGSHNPAKDNGLKLVHRHRPFFGDDVRRLAAMAAAGDWEQGAGDVREEPVRAAYVERLLRGFEGGAFRIGWDAGNGAAGPVIEQLAEALPGEHHLLFTDVDGDFPNHHPDPSVEANLADLRRLVADKRLDFGLAFDGDGDRLGVVDARRRVLWGDAILSILAPSVLADHPGQAIIADVKSSDHVFDTIARAGGRPVMAKTGHSHIKNRMREEAAPLAGELSGHIFFGAGWYGFDDALYAAIRLISAVHRSGRSLAELRDAMPPLVATPDLRLPVAEARAAAIVDAVADRLATAGIAVDLTDGVRVRDREGWWLLRASNTEAAVTVRAEAGDAAALDRVLASVDAHLAAVGAPSARSLFRSLAPT